MSIRIDKSKCDGCGRCAEICPGNLIKMVGKGPNRKAEMTYPDECWGCMSCVKACPRHAIEFYLGDDIGGQGKSLVTKMSSKKIDWQVCQNGCIVQQILMVRKNANKY